MKKQERTSTFLAALGDLPSPPDGQDTEQSPSASRTDSAKEASNDTGQTSPSPTTSTTSTEETMRESPSSQVDFLANHSVQPGSDEARRMTERSGRKWLALLTRQDPLGYLARTLLVSKRWASTQCFLTWKAWDTPSKHSLYRLTAVFVFSAFCIQSLGKNYVFNNNKKSSKIMKRNIRKKNIFIFLTT